MNGCKLSNIPGYHAAIAAAREQEQRIREDNWLELSHAIWGVRIRQMTVADYVLLERSENPFVTRQVPSLDDLAQFLWILSPERLAWDMELGWRKPWLPLARRLAAYRHGYRCRQKFRRDVPENFEAVECFQSAVVQCFEYMDLMFFDLPASQKNSGASPIHFLTSWMDTLLTEYPSYTEEKVWATPLPKMFGLFKAIRSRKNPDAVDISKLTAAVNARISAAIRQGKPLDQIFTHANN